MADHNFTNITVEDLRDYSLAAFDKDGKHDVGMICPQRGSQKDTANFRVYDTQAFNSDLFQAIADGDVAPYGTWGHSTDSYSVDVFGLRDFISDRDVANEMDAIDLSRDTALFLARNGKAQRNQAFVSSHLVDNSQWDTVLTGIVTAVPGGIDGTNQFQQFDQAASTPLYVLDLAFEAMLGSTGLRPDTVVIPRQLMTVLKQNDEINQYGINNPVGGVAGGEEYTVSIIAQFLGIEASRVHVIDATVDKATVTVTPATLGEVSNKNFGDKLSQGAENHGFIAPRNILVAHMGDMNAGLRSQSASVEFLWTGLYSGTGERGNYKVKTNYDQDREGLWVEARQAFVFKVVAPKLGILLKEAIA